MVVQFPGPSSRPWRPRSHYVIMRTYQSNANISPAMGSMASQHNNTGKGFPSRAAFDIGISIRGRGGFVDTVMVMGQLTECEM